MQIEVHFVNCCDDCYDDESADDVDDVRDDVLYAI
jgi:hypothetical protein